ncbi:unnamed protein product [Trichogramma brassicae]|uniref:Uncharacterized protein n=1 Tax=Trichogramma brassicae TaxID=86971 RepID=A0A6H5J5V7_9HYME|nr:unnamed protein product [Trichogramma brassicae]
MLSHRAELNAFLTSRVTTAQYFLVKPPRNHLLPATAFRTVEMTSPIASIVDHPFRKQYCRVFFFFSSTTSTPFGYSRSPPDLGSRGAPASVPTEVSCNAENGVIGSWLHETRLASRRTRRVVFLATACHFRGYRLSFSSRVAYTSSEHQCSRLLLRIQLVSVNHTQHTLRAEAHTLTFTLGTHSSCVAGRGSARNAGQDGKVLTLCLAHDVHDRTGIPPRRRGHAGSAALPGSRLFGHTDVEGAGQINGVGVGSEEGLVHHEDRTHSHSMLAATKNAPTLRCYHPKFEYTPIYTFTLTRYSTTL